MNYLDWIILLLMALAAVRGYHRGLLSAITGLVGLLAGFSAALVLARPAADFLDARYHVAGKITVWLVDKFPGLTALAQPANDSITADLYRTVLSAVAGNIAQTNVAGLVNGLGYMVWVAVVFLLLLVITSFTLRVLALIITKSISRTFFGGINRLGGLLAASLAMAVGLGLVLAVISPVLAAGASLPDGGSLGTFSTALKESLLAPKLIFLFRFVMTKLFLA